MTYWTGDDELFALMRRELFTAVVGDVMDVAGLIHQFLPAAIRPLRPEMVLAGRAMPVLEANCSGQMVAHSGTRQPFGLMLAALDDLKPNEIYLCTGATPNFALWGGLMTIRAKHLGAAGVVLDGYHRDTHEILSLGFPTFSHGNYAQDQGIRGRVIDFRCPVEFANGVLVRPGDLIFGDVDGVVMVPREHEQEIISKALEKVRGESEVRTAIESGMSATEAFRTFGIM